MIEENISYSFENLKFSVIDPTKTKCAVFQGHVIIRNKIFRFNLHVSLLNSGEWKLERLSWNKKTPPILLDIQLVQQLTNKAARLLYTVNAWPGEQSKTGAGLVLNQKIPPKEVLNEVHISFRPDILSLSSPSWDEIWDLIECRAKYDEHFRVQGFSLSEVLKAIEELRLIFPSSWVKKQYKNTISSTGLAPEMGMDYPRNVPFWYPSYQIARTALGAICIDPAWNYLVELGLSIKQLENIPNIELLKNRLTKSDGNQHHVCLASDLHMKGLLIEVEPSISNGSYKNDMSVEYNGNIIDIELKAFTSATPSKRLIQEIDKKVKSLPENISRPLIFHAVLIEKEASFFEAIESLSDELSSKISALVGGRIFVDSSGGRLKRDCGRILVNKKAQFVLSKKDIENIFKPNYQSLKYPLFGFGSFMYFGTKQ